MVLLVGAVLLVQTFVRLLRVDSGFNADGVLTMEVSLPQSAYPGATAPAFFDRVIGRLREVPGVIAVGATSGLPLTGAENLRQLTFEGQPLPLTGQEVVADYRAVTPDYFAVMGIPLRAGARLAAEWRPAASELVVNETLARLAWPGQDPIGRRVKLTRFDQAGPWYTVVGVVGDTHHTALDSSVRPQVYVDHHEDSSQQMFVVLRGSTDPLGFAGAARGAVTELDRDHPVGRIQTMQAIVAESVANRRFAMSLVATFAILAFVLAQVGLYAVVSQSVSEPTREMGLRLAHGASPASLLRLVLREGLSLAVLGIVVGFASAFVMTRFIEALLFGVAAHDVATFGLVALLLVAASAAGCLIPARRAMRVDPLVTLRSE
jgi:predicted permease